MSNYMAMPGAIANGSMSTQQFYAVKSTTASPYEVGVCTAAADLAIGILQNNPNTSGHGAEVALLGVCKAQVDGTVVTGAYLAPAADGRLTSVAIDGTTGITLLARSLESGTSGQNIFVFLTGPVVLSST